MLHRFIDQFKPARTHSHKGINAWNINHDVLNDPLETFVLVTEVFVTKEIWMLNKCRFNERRKKNANKKCWPLLFLLLSPNMLMIPRSHFVLPCFLRLFQLFSLLIDTSNPTKNNILPPNQKYLFISTTL